MTRRTERVAVIGAGPSGLASAMLLAHAGFDVRVFEQAPEVGGRTGRLRTGPYSFDVGSTLLMMKFVVDELFERVGRRPESYCRFFRLDPMYRLDLGDRQVEMSCDEERTRASIEAAFPGEGAGLRRFLKAEGRRLEALYPCLLRSYDGLTDLLAPEVLEAAPYINLHRSLHSTMGRYFRSEALRLAFSFQSAYLGMSPWECPGGFGIIPYVEHAYGIYHVEGGVSAVCRAMAKVVEEEGGNLHTGTPVRRVVVRDGQARSVELADGERVDVDRVVLNADFAWAASHLFDDGTLRRFTPRRLERMKFSCSTFMLYLGLDKRFERPHHTFVFSDSYRREMADVFRTGRVSEDASIYVCNPSVTDPTLAPEGHSALYVLALVPNLRTGSVDWATAGPRLKDWLLDRIETRWALSPVRPHIVEETVVTPEDWRDQLNVQHGAVFNLRHTPTQLVALRPPSRLAEVSNLYLAGGGTSPGSGLPTVLEAGRIAAGRILESFGLKPKPCRGLPDRIVEDCGVGRKVRGACS